MTEIDRIGKDRTGLEQKTTGQDNNVQTGTGLERTENLREGKSINFCDHLKVSLSLLVFKAIIRQIT
jgi:hypothetical protein